MYEKIVSSFLSSAVSCEVSVETSCRIRKSYGAKGRSFRLRNSDALLRCVNYSLLLMLLFVNMEVVL